MITSTSSWRLWRKTFVVSSDITWNTQYGTSGCGFVLRSDGNKNALNQYMVIATRGASGHVLFVTMSQGKIVGGRDIYAYGIDPELQLAEQRHQPPDGRRARQYLQHLLKRHADR